MYRRNKTRSCSSNTTVVGYTEILRRDCPVSGKCLALKNPGSQNVESQNPGSQNLGSQNPGNQNPGNQNPGIPNPGSQILRSSSRSSKLF